MKKKNLLSLVVVMTLIVLMVSVSSAQTGKVTQEVQYNNIGVILNGKRLNLVDSKGNSVEPFMYNNTNYLPVRAISEALGLEVSFDSEQNAVVLSSTESQETTYITRTGSKYHYDENCNGGTYWPVPRSTAIGMGLTPCEKCVHDEGESDKVSVDELLFSKEHVRFYYTGYNKTNDGYELYLRVENDSDYKITGRIAPDPQVGNKKCPMSLSFNADPGRTANGTITISDKDLKEAGITEFKSIRAAFSIHDTQNLPYELDFGTGFITIRLENN